MKFLLDENLQYPSGMTVYFDKVGKDAEMVVKIPIKYFTNTDRFKFAIATVEPGQKEVTDVAGGGSDGEIQPFSIAAPGTQVEYVKTYTYYLYDENGNILCELDKDGNIKEKYLYGNGLIAKRTDKTVQTTYFYHQDPVGSIIMITNNIGNILTQYKYTAFGTIMEQTGSLNNDILFAGKEQDKNGLYSFPARYYSPGLGKFITTDPYLPGRSYTYCANNPVNYIDPMGLWEDSPEYGPRTIKTNIDWDELIREAIESGAQILTKIDYTDPSSGLINTSFDVSALLSTLSNNFAGWGAQYQNAPGHGNPPPDVISISLVNLIAAYSPSSVDPLTYGKRGRLPPQEAPRPGMPNYIDFQGWIGFVTGGYSQEFSSGKEYIYFGILANIGIWPPIPFGGSINAGYSKIYPGINFIFQAGGGTGGQVGFSHTGWNLFRGYHGYKEVSGMVLPANVGAGVIFIIPISRSQ